MPIIVGSKCPYCTKFRAPSEIIPFSGGGKICVPCFHQHEAALLALAGLKANADGTLTSSAPPPAECSECHVTHQELQQQGRGGDTWAVIFEGGVYRFFCRPCADVYETKRREFFKDTAYAKQRGL